MRLMKSSKHSFDNSKTPFDIAFSLKEWQYYFPYTLVTCLRFLQLICRIFLLQTAISTSLLYGLFHSIYEDVFGCSSERIFLSIPSPFIGTIHSVYVGVDQPRQWRLHSYLALLHWKEWRLEVPTRRGRESMVSEQEPTAQK